MCNPSQGYYQPNTQTIYQEYGYKDRMHYLECLAEDEGVDFETVYHLSKLLGEQEDYNHSVMSESQIPLDGLVTSIQDYTDWN